MLRLTTKQAADLLGTQEWRIRRLFETGDVPEVERFAGKRIIDGKRLLAIIELLSTRNWISDQPVERHLQNAVAAIAAGNGAEARRHLRLLSDETKTTVIIGADLEPLS